MTKVCCSPTSDRSTSTGFRSYVRRVISASRRVLKTGAVLVFGLTRAKSPAVELKAALWIIDRVGVMEEEGALGLVEPPLFSTKDEGAEFKAGVHVWEERRQTGSEATVLEIEEAAQSSTCGNVLEEAGSRLISVNARRRQKTNETNRN